MERLSTDLFFVSIIRDNINQINMTNKNTYDLMMNLLNNYLIYWGKITEMIFNQVYSYKKIPTRFYVIIGKICTTEIIEYTCKCEDKRHDCLTMIDTRGIEINKN